MPVIDGVDFWRCYSEEPEAEKRYGPVEVWTASDGEYRTKRYISVRILEREPRMLYTAFAEMNRDLENQRTAAEKRNSNSQ